MDTIGTIESRREAILGELREIRSLRRGTLNKQFLKVKHKGMKDPVLRGPYYVLSRRRNTATVSERVPADAVEQTLHDIHAHKKFVVLCKEYEELTERLGQVTRNAQAEGLKKKQSKSRSRKMPK